MAELHNPQIDFSILGNLGEIYDQAKDKATLADLGERLAAGTINYKEAAGLAAKANRFDIALPLLEQHNNKQAGIAMLNAIPGAQKPQIPLGAIGQPAPAGAGGQVAPGPAPAPVNAPRPPVTPTARVWGDDEAVRAGLYDPPPTSPPKLMAAAPAAAVSDVPPENIAPPAGVVTPAPGMSAGPPRPRPAEAPSAPPDAVPASGMPAANPAAPQSPPRPAPTAPQLGGNMPGSGLTLINSPALQGMPAGLRQALPAMLASKQYAPQALAVIQKYMNPEQWQLFRDTMGNVFTRNNATGESKPLIQATPQMMNANASGLPTPLAYEAATQMSGAAADNTKLTPEQKNVAPLPGRGAMNAAAAGAEAKSVGDALGDMGKSIATKGLAATKTLTTLQRMSQLNDAAYEGAAAPALQHARSLLTTLGIPSDTVAKGEEFIALSNRMVLDANNGSLGVGVSNADVQYLSNMNPNIAQTVAGRRQIIETSAALAKRDQQVALMASQYRRVNGTLDGFDSVAADYAEKNPLFAGRSGVTAPAGSVAPGAPALPAGWSVKVK